MRLAALALLLLPTQVLAQPAAAPADEEIQITLTAKEIDQIGKALADLPYKDVVQLLNKIVIQFQQHVAKKNSPPPEAPK